MSASEVFARLTTALERAGIAYMLSGSFASAYYGAPRSTQDIDFVIESSSAQLVALVESLPREQYYWDLPTALEAHQRQSMFNVIDLATGWKIDLIIRKARAFSQEEFSRRRRADVDGVPIFVASPEDVVLTKLEWSKLSQSQRQLEDVVAIFRSRWELLDRGYLGKWIAELRLQAEWNVAQARAGISV